MHCMRMAILVMGTGRFAPHPPPFPGFERVCLSVLMRVGQSHARTTQSRIPVRPVGWFHLDYIGPHLPPVPSAPPPRSLDVSRASPSALLSSSYSVACLPGSPSPLLYSLCSSKTSLQAFFVVGIYYDLSQQIAFVRLINSTLCTAMATTTSLLRGW